MIAKTFSSTGKQSLTDLKAGKVVLGPDQRGGIYLLGMSASNCRLPVCWKESPGIPAMFSMRSVRPHQPIPAF
jgi:hypothetical protein